jgi:hypothetical protein
MTLDEIVTEMARKPDAHRVLEWIADEAATIEDARTAADAYLES